ncbi:unnamed protein product [Candidula unifasciata]|uniref:J domain-containing protein n=1 Tax=Candidula unifasciata TaxID=100452 RepID=A0A8S3YE12_9EUPU|nr:unnamed protein product [Candidula unifasciata]
MAVREATKSSAKVDYCIRLLKRQVCNTFKCFTSSLFVRPFLKPPDLFTNDLTANITISTRTISTSTRIRNRSSLTVTTASTSSQLAVTNVMSHLLAGDLHINNSHIYNSAHFGFQPRRNASSRASARKPTKHSHYYDVLGLNPTATQNQIKSAYYKMSKLHHPDVTECTKSHALFTEINEAYETLGDLRKRRLYDRGLFKPGVRPNFAAESAVNEDGGDYTEAYRKRSVFDRGDRPPPPMGRSKIYNFDEFYRQHYGDLRERRWKEGIEYMKFKESMEENKKVQEQNVHNYLVGTVLALTFLFGFMLYTNVDYDVNKLQEARKKSAGNSNGDT